MKKQQPIHGALRARTRAFLCAITLALLCFTAPAKAQIWGTENSVAIGATTVTNASLNVTVTPDDPVNPTKKYVVIVAEQSGSPSRKVWVTLVVDASATVTGFDDIPAGTYNINDSELPGTALASQGLNANAFDAYITGTGAKAYNSSSDFWWYHGKEAVGDHQSYVVVGDDYTGAGHNVMYVLCSSFHDATQTTNNAITLYVCNSGTISGYEYVKTYTACGTGTVTRNTRANRVGRKVDLTATPTAPATFIEWRDGDGNFISTDNPYTTLGWGPEEFVAVFSDGVGCPSAAPATPTYTITWVDGNGDEIYHETVTEGDVPAFDDRTTPTKTQTAQYTYTFNNTWSPTPYAADKDQTYTAQFNQTTRQYTITVTSAGHGTVTGGGTYDYGTSVPLTATPDTYYSFGSWTDAGAQNHNVTVTGTAFYTASFTLNTSSTLDINDNENTTYYSTILAAYNGTPMDISIMRKFFAGMWNTVCFPFDLTAAQRSSSDMSAATFYTLSSVTGDAAEGLDFNVTAITTETMTARTPYLVQFTGADINNPTFTGVTLTANAFTNNTTGQSVGETKFFGTVHPTSLINSMADANEESGFLFLGQNNNLYWPNVVNDIRAFRAYFYSGNNAVQAIHPRVRIVLQNETTTGIEEIGVPGESGTSGVSGESGKSGLSGASVKKYLRNGSLIIERDGIRYNAVGEQIK